MGTSQLLCDGLESLVVTQVVEVNVYKYLRSLRSRKYLCVFNSLTLYRNEKCDLYVICK